MILLVCCRAYKTIIEDDLKFPLIYGEGKKVKDFVMFMDWVLVDIITEQHSICMVL